MGNIVMMLSDIKKGDTLAHDLLYEYVHLYHIESIFIFCYEEIKAHHILFCCVPEQKSADQN
jgi:hypothetical protein